MEMRWYEESDGVCFAVMTDGCSALKGVHPKCGTYRCPFYKPKDCQDWVRKDARSAVYLLMPEEVEHGED